VIRAPFSSRANLRSRLLAVAALSAAMAMLLLVVEFRRCADENARFIHLVWVVTNTFVILSFLFRTLNLAELPREPGVTLLFAYWIYFVFGASAPLLGDIDDAMGSLLHRVEVGWPQILECDALNGLGLSLALGTYCCTPSRGLTSLMTRPVRSLGRWKPLSVAAVMLLIGGVCYLPLMMWRSAGLSPDALPGGSILWRSGSLLDTGLILVAALATRRDLLLISIAILLGSTQLLCGVLAATKTEALLPVVAVFVGLVARYPTRRTLFWGVLGLATCFAASVSLISAIRITPDSDENGKLGRALHALEELAVDPLATARESSISAINRLCYLPAQASAIRLFRQGEADPRWRDIPWVLVPRALVPDKPTLSDRGLDFNEAIGGYRDSYASPTVFVDGYYQSGWPGFVITASVVGVILGGFRDVAALVLSSRALALLPIVALGHYAAFRIDGGLIGDYLFPYLLLSLCMAITWVICATRTRDPDGSLSRRVP
jgi:hypothetical protein